MEFVMNPSMDGQAKACPTKRADFLRGGACFSLPSHGTCGDWLKSFSPGNPKTRGDFRSSETRLRPPDLGGMRVISSSRSKNIIGRPMNADQNKPFCYRR